MQTSSDPHILTPHPVVSVIIPVYNQAEFLSATIQSVLAQSYPHFEIIVVDDASQDDARAVVGGFSDARMTYISHERNERLPAARNTGIRAAGGELVAFLDADDLFHPEKIGAHVDYFERHPGVDVTYNARFELNHSSPSIREIWWPPSTVDLSDLIRGFPFAPSDMVVRRRRLAEVGLFDPRMGSAEDTDLPCRLALAGCQFSGLDRVLNSRRYHAGRGRKNLAGRRDDVARALEAVFADPRCPGDVRATQPVAMTHHSMVLLSLALMQDERDLAREFADELVLRNPSVLEGRPCELTEFLMMESVADEAEDHEVVLRRMFSRLPPALECISDQYGWAVGRGYLWKGLRALLWNRTHTARQWLVHAATSNVPIDERFLQFLTSHLLNHARAFGSEDARAALDRVAAGVQQVGGRRWARRLRGSYLLNRAFEQFHSGDTRDVPRTVVQALGSDPSHLVNRGVLSMIVQSMIAGDARR